MLSEDSLIYEFHVRAFNISMLKLLVMIWLTLPTTIPIDIIWPTTLATERTCTCLLFIMLPCKRCMQSSNFSILLDGILIENCSESKSAPSHVSCCTGSQQDLSTFGTKPDNNKSFLMSLDTLCIYSFPFPQANPSSRYIIALFPSPRHFAISGRVTLEYR